MVSILIQHIELEENTNIPSHYSVDLRTTDGTVYMYRAHYSVDLWTTDGTVSGTETKRSVNNQQHNFTANVKPLDDQAAQQFIGNLTMKYFHLVTVWDWNLGSRVRLFSGSRSQF